ncbi:RnfABCDGE type electron transport complex subunit D [Actinomadura sp. 3N407]|uniref:RnfABCDGE type electron transport complex subunit D n=1 Tax=Actinomadura sp. 3N407 TaxID=3457423 RepID=UPI003FCD4774
MSSVVTPSDTSSPSGRPEGGSGGTPAGTRKKDLRVMALRRFALSISVFTVVGHLWLGMETPWAAPVVAVLASYTTEIVLECVQAWSEARRPRFLGGWNAFVTFLLPAHISGLAIAMLIYPGARLWPFAFAAVVAGSAKYLFRAPVGGRSRHFMNPSNLGIAATLTLFPWVGIAMPYHFTEPFGGILDWIVPLALLASGLMLNLQLTGKWGIIVGWVGGFVAQAVIRALVTDTELGAALAPMTGVAFLLFTTYMITDPGTSPVRPRGQIAFSLVAAALYGVLMSAHIVFGIFYCLVLTCLMRGALLWGLDLRARAGSSRSAGEPGVTATAAAQSG